MAEKTVPVATAEESNLPATRDEGRYLIPPVDIYETEAGLTVVADLPGVKKEDLDIQVDDGVLTIRGKVTADSAGTALYQEYELMNFFRQFELSDEVDQEKIQANLSGGVLTLSLPKAEKAKPKKIAVKVE